MPRGRAWASADNYFHRPVRTPNPFAGNHDGKWASLSPKSAQNASTGLVVDLNGMEFCTRSEKLAEELGNYSTFVRGFLMKCALTGTTDKTILAHLDKIASDFGADAAQEIRGALEKRGGPPGAGNFLKNLWQGAKDVVPSAGRWLGRSFRGPANVTANAGRATPGAAAGAASHVVPPAPRPFDFNMNASAAPVPHTPLTPPPVTPRPWYSGGNLLGSAMGSYGGSMVGDEMAENYLPENMRWAGGSLGAVAGGVLGNRSMGNRAGRMREVNIPVQAFQHAGAGAWCRLCCGSGHEPGLRSA